MFPSLNFIFASRLEQMVALVLIGVFISSALKIVLAPCFGETGARLISSAALFMMALVLGGRVAHEALVWQSAFAAQILSDALGPLKAAVQELMSSADNLSQ